MADSAPDVTHLLLALDGDDPAAVDALLPHVYTELQAMARRQLRGERAGHTLDTAALVHEALKRDASLIRYASARLKNDARFVRRAITAAGAGWPESVLPHVGEDLRGLLTTVCGDDSLL